MVLVLLGVVLTIAVIILHNQFLGFRAQTPADYANGGPVFDIRDRLNGPIVCEGVIYGPMGRVTGRFVAEFQASWQGNVGVMTEHFRYDSGAVQDRQWTLTVGADGAIRAEAPDVIGVGTGQQAGNAVLLNYRIKLSPEAGGHVLDTTDWMYLTETGVIMNRSQFRKYGIKVAELVATMRPKAA
jgi:hypothetical protein